MKAEIVSLEHTSRSEDHSECKPSGTLSSSKYCMAEGCIETGNLNIVYVKPLGQQEDIYAVKLCGNHTKTEGQLNLEKYCKLG